MGWEFSVWEVVWKGFDDGRKMALDFYQKDGVFPMFLLDGGDTE